MAKFTQGNILRHVVVMSLTSSVGLMAIFLVDLINVVYISWLGDAVLTAAMGYAATILFFSSAVGIGLGIGIAAQVSRALGAGASDLARQRTSEGLVISLIVGVLVSVISFPLLPMLASLLGAEGRVAEETLHYMQLITLAQPMMMIGMTGSAILRARGEARASMMVTVWGAIVLAILDPLFVLWMDWELTGAAIAGWGSRATIMIMSLWPIWRRFGGFVRVSPKAMIRALRPLGVVAVPAVLAQLATPVGQALVTRMIADHGEEAVAGMAIIGRLTPVAFALVLALAGALGPIVGQNMGAGRFDRVKRAFWDSVLFSGVVILAVSGILYLLRPLIVEMFHAEGLTKDLIYLFCGPLSLLFFFNALIFAANAVCNNLGAAFTSAMINWGRNTLGTWPFALWGMHMWGAAGVLIGQALGGIVFGLLGLILALRVIAKRSASSD